MTQAHILGFPRIGSHRQMKKAVESYWRGEIALSELEKIGEQIQKNNWQLQTQAGLDYVTVGDFSWYDHVLDTSALLGVIPPRFKKNQQEPVSLNTIFLMARGQAPQLPETTACEMTKWFNTNYHYIVPEFNAEQIFTIASEYLFNSIRLAQAQAHAVKPVLLGPLSFLWLGKSKDKHFNKLDLLKRLLPVYQQVLDRLHALKIELLQIDEPILVLDLPKEWQTAFNTAYHQLNFRGIKSLLTTYFGTLEDNYHFVKELPVSGIHFDFANNTELLIEIAQNFPKDKFLSAGVINGRNIWKADIKKCFELLKQAQQHLQERLWVSSSCSLLHVPVDLAAEKKLSPDIKNWLAFAKQKVDEVVLLSNLLKQGQESFSKQLADNQAAIQSRKVSRQIHNPAVQARTAQLTADFARRNSEYRKRAGAQRKKLNLPLFPTTTIGSFPQTTKIRGLRQEYHSGKITEKEYILKLKTEIAEVIKKQEALNLDVLVHGESERNDMVEYFGELLQGFAFTQNGWVQSYGSRCVKPPIIYGDVQRTQPMTVEWISYAQSCSQRPVKGMLTGPVTILSWSFVRDDQPLEATSLQIAFALRDEVCDLEKAGVQIIQIDEPAFREALPLRKNQWRLYLKWAVNCFRVASSGVKDETQIHTHMCYSEFNDIIEAIADLDADVITIENSRSELELFKSFESFAYPNELGPGVYDIHSPRIPTSEEMMARLEGALPFIPAERLWVNPDCGLKTRNWPEVEQALANMVKAAKNCRIKYAKQPLVEKT